jgi:hypothetical protein
VKRHIALVLGLALGLPFVAVGVIEIARDQAGTPPQRFVTWVLGGNVVVDLFVVPAASLIGIAIVRRMPDALRAPIRAALFATAVVLALAWPALRGYGRDRVPSNPSVQPLNYATATLTVLAVVWVVTALWSGVIMVRARRRTDAGA